jgi:hypothetical protein
MPREKAAADIQYPSVNNQSQVTVSYSDFGDVPDICASAAILTGTCAGKAGRVKVVGKTSTAATIEVLAPNASNNTLNPLDEGTQVQISFTAVR